jgi:hypothetical protein
MTQKQAASLHQSRREGLDFKRTISPNQPRIYFSRFQPKKRMSSPECS